jgi:hypothetical protein
LILQTEWFRFFSAYKDSILWKKPDEKSLDKGKKPSEREDLSLGRFKSLHFQTAGILSPFFQNHGPNKVPET